MAKYVFDSNIFMNLQQRQPLDLYPSVWNKVSELMDNGIIISSHEVYEEILAGNDGLVEWVKSREACFYASDEKIQQDVREILKTHRGLVEGGKKMNNADPFVIALAKEYGCKVVSSESPSGNPKVPRIPDVCNSMGIEYISFVNFQREMHFSF